MVLVLSEADVQQLLPMSAAIEQVEASLLAQQRGQAVNRPRQRIFLQQASLHYMAAALPEEGLFGMKVYTVTSRGMQFVVLLFSAEQGDLLALVEADHLGRLRTGAASAVATRFLARAEASQVGLIGAGRQARTQLEAVACVRKLSKARVYCRDAGRRREFCREMQSRLGLAVESAESAEAAVRSADIVITATNARQPVLHGGWLRPGAHINAIGSNMPNRREMDDTVLARASILTVDSIEQAREEAGDLIQGLPSAGRGWDELVELREVVAGARPGRRTAEEITLFKSCGIAIWDAAVGGYVYRQALRLGKGRELRIGER
jgi:alanine dehydrogenase